MTVAFVVMAHPSRYVEAEGLAYRLPNATIAYDPGGAQPSAWRAARNAWRAGIDQARDHVVVVQDDARPARGFGAAATNAIRARPLGMVAFYLGHMHAASWRLRAMAERCERWCELPTGYFVPTVALAMPTSVADHALRWADETGVDRDYRWDDEVFGQYRQAMGTPAWATIPSLVEHRNDLPSVIGHESHGRRGAACPWGSYIPHRPVRDIQW